MRRLVDNFPVSRYMCAHAALTFGAAAGHGGGGAVRLQPARAGAAADVPPSERVVVVRGRGAAGAAAVGDFYWLPFVLTSELLSGRWLGLRQTHLAQFRSSRILSSSPPQDPAAAQPVDQLHMQPLSHHDLRKIDSMLSSEAIAQVHLLL